MGEEAACDSASTGWRARGDGGDGRRERVAAGAAARGRAYHERQRENSVADDLGGLAVAEEEDALLVEQRVERTEQARLEALEELGQRGVGQFLRLQQQWHAQRDLRVEPRYAAHLLELGPRRAVREHQPVHLPLHVADGRQQRCGQRRERLEEVAALLIGWDRVLAEARRRGVQAVHSEQQHRLPHVYLRTPYGWGDAGA